MSRVACLTAESLHAQQYSDSLLKKYAKVKPKEQPPSYDYLKGAKKLRAERDSDRLQKVEDHAAPKIQCRSHN
jgi:hypothetical protein